jgi:hypothetical protein
VSTGLFLECGSLFKTRKTVIELSSVFLRELRKAMAVEKKKKAPAAPKANAASASALERESGVGGEAQTSCDFPELIADKWKANELSSSDCPSEPASQPPPCARESVR